MRTLLLTDNNIGSSDEPDQIQNRRDIESLFPIASTNIEDLCRINENLLIYPQSIEETDDRIGKLPVFTLENTTNPEQVKIVTGNIMGFIGLGDVQLKIKSRFDAGRDDYLLHYMLQRVFSFNLFDLNHNNEQEDVFDFLMFMFPCFLKKALRQGVYREYKRYQHNDAHVKGSIDVQRHIQKNIPFQGNVAYNTREYSSDNQMMQLIRHTVEFMRTKQYGSVILSIDKETTENVALIVEHTPTYSKSQRGTVIRDNLRPASHPYYTEYRPLQQLCLQILRMEEVKYGNQEDSICGILFDGAWLWEEYVNTVLQGEGFTHPENKKKKGSIFLFEDLKEDGKIHLSGRRYPDFYKEDFVLDAKYKRLEKCKRVSDVGGDDLHQVMAYMFRLKASRGGFVVPLAEKETLSLRSHLAGYGGSMAIFGIQISKASHSYQEFCVQMKDAERKFLADITNF